MPSRKRHNDPLPAPPWQRAPQRSAKRKRDEPITQEAIVETAVRLLDADGLDGLSMRRIADELHTGPASLYWHVGSKDGLLDLIFDQVIGEQPVPDPDPKRWKEQLKEVGRGQRQAILNHRDVVRISIGRIPMGPNALLWSERVLAVIRAGGVPDQLALDGLTLLIAVVNGFCLDETAAGWDGDEDQAEGGDPDMASQYIRSLPADRFPNLTALADKFVLGDQDARFELLLDLYVDGLEQRAAPSK